MRICKPFPSLAWVDTDQWGVPLAVYFTRASSLSKDIWTEEIYVYVNILCLMVCFRIDRRRCE